MRLSFLSSRLAYNQMAIIVVIFSTFLAALRLFEQMRVFTKINLRCIGTKFLPYVPSTVAKLGLSQSRGCRLRIAAKLGVKCFDCSFDIGDAARVLVEEGRKVQ